MHQDKSSREFLLWQAESGIDEWVGDFPLNRFEKNIHDRDSMDIDQHKKRPAETISNQLKDSKQEEKLLELQNHSGNQGSISERAIQTAKRSAEAATSVNELRELIENFEHCSLKNTAMNTVFSDGNEGSKLMVIAGVPGAEEDREGIPISGVNQQLLKSMLESINLDPSDYYLTSVVFWRPPGDRDPTLEEISVCLPFVDRHIELVSPELLIVLGGIASKSILRINKGINKIRGKWFEYTTPTLLAPIQAMPIYHPENLLNLPSYKRNTWRDLLEIKKKLS